MDTRAFELPRALSSSRSAQRLKTAAAMLAGSSVAGRFSASMMLLTKWRSFGWGQTPSIEFLLGWVSGFAERALGKRVYQTASDFHLRVVAEMAASPLKGHLNKHRL
jgi:hypothetical protein